METHFFNGQGYIYLPIYSAFKTDIKETYCALTTAQEIEMTCNRGLQVSQMRTHFLEMSLITKVITSKVKSQVSTIAYSNTGKIQDRKEPGQEEGHKITFKKQKELIPAKVVERQNLKNKKK